MRKLFLLLFGVVGLSFSAFSQNIIGFTLPKGKKKVSIPFEQVNNLIVVPVTINNSLTVKFIVDTGASASILTEKAYADAMRLNYARSIRISGPGIVDSVEAFVATGVQIDLPDEVKGSLLSLLVLKEDYLQLNENLGDDIYGIIGFDIFSRFVVEINYDNSRLTLRDPKRFKAKKRWTYLDITLEDTKPYVLTELRQGDYRDSIKLMVDTGASHALLLDVSNTDDLERPEEVIPARLGRGLGGEIPGYVGRIDGYRMSEYEFENILVSIPEEGAYSDDIKRGSRHGTVGGDLLNRFNVIFDYFSRRLYFRKSRRYKSPFDFDMSGLTLIVKGENLDVLVVKRVQEGTPAFEAGVRAGDVITMINGRNLNNSEFTEINALLRQGEGYNIKATLRRGGETLVKKFKLAKRI